jgi:hypothetical protein
LALRTSRSSRGAGAGPIRHYPLGRVSGIPRSSVQSGRTTAPRLPHFAHRMFEANDVIMTSSGSSSTLRVLAKPQVPQVTYSERTPRARMCPSVTGWVGRLLVGGSGGFLPMGAKRRSRCEGSGSGNRCKKWQLRRPVKIKAPRLGLQTRGHEPSPSQQLWFLALAITQRADYLPRTCLFCDRRQPRKGPSVPR